MYSNAPATSISILPEPFKSAVTNSRLWKWERSQHMETTGCLASLFPKDDTQDVSFTLGLKVHARPPDVTCISWRNLVRRIFCYIFFKGVTMCRCLIVNRKIFAFEVYGSCVRQIRRESMTRDIFFFLPWKSSLTSLHEGAGVEAKAQNFEISVSRPEYWVRGLNPQMALVLKGS